MTVQLKPQFLPRLIIDPPTTPFTHTSPKKPPQDSTKWLDQVCPMSRFLWLGADALRLGIRIGLNKGYETTAIPKTLKPSHRKGKLSKKTQFVRSVVREVVGFAPYERRVLELLRNSKVCTLQLPDLRSLNSFISCRIRRPGS